MADGDSEPHSEPHEEARVDDFGFGRFVALAGEHTAVAIVDPVRAAPLAHAGKPHAESILLVHSPQYRRSAFAATEGLDSDTKGEVGSRRGRGSGERARGGVLGRGGSRFVSYRALFTNMELHWRQ